MASTPAPTLSPGDEWLMRVYHYIPNDDAAYLFIALFSLFVVVIFAQTELVYGGRFMHIIVLGGMLEALGYGTRVLVTENHDTGTLIVTSLFLLLAPILFAFVNYATTGWLLASVADVRVRVLLCTVSPRHIALLFLASDVVCMLLQAAGGAMLADGVKTSLANAIVIAGLAVQLTFLSAFSWIVLRMRFQDAQFPFKRVPSLHPLFLALLVTTACILVRTLYRLAYFAANAAAPDSYIIQAQWLFFVFDSALMSLMMATFVALPLNKYLQNHVERPQWKVELEEALRAGAKAEGARSQPAAGSTGSAAALSAKEQEPDAESAAASGRLPATASSSSRPAAQGEPEQARGELAHV